LETNAPIITVDNGNSNPHIGVFDGHRDPKLFTVAEFAKIQSRYTLKDTQILVSDVGKSHPLIRKLQAQAIDLTQFKTPDMFMDMPVDYGDTLGEDRLFQSYYLYKTQVIDKKIGRVLLIDSGTFMTFDIIDSKGFRGGFIAPGVQTFLNSYKEGANLPQMEESELNPYVKLGYPHSTEEAILHATIIYLISYYEKIMESYGPFEHIVVTGGDMEKQALILSRLKDIQFDLVPNLIHYSLRYIYDEIQRRLK